MKKIFLITCLNLLLCATYAQVGIGNVSPNNNAILDLSNTNNRGLLLPKLSSGHPATPSGLLFFNDEDSVIYYNEGSNNYNGLSPWRYKFGSGVIVSENTYYNKSGNVGIGTESPEKKLHVTDDGEILIIEGTASAFLSFYKNGYVAGRSGRVGFITATDVLRIQNEELNGDIDITTEGSGDLNVTNGDVDIQDGKIKEYGNELLPRGAIIMWSGTTIPDGWALCDGDSYAKVDGSGPVTVPDLKGRFIVGIDPTDADYDNIGINGNVGTKTTTLTESQMPSHIHSTNVSNDTHSHGLKIDNGGGGSGLTGLTASFYSGDNALANGTSNTAINSDTHKHTVTLNPTGGNASHENRPPYYALAFIYKL
jgi:microcystin-dependent protein